MYLNATFFILLTLCSKSLRCTMKSFSTITSKQSYQHVLNLIKFDLC